VPGGDENVRRLATAAITERDAALANYFVPRGYVVVLQDVRGRYRSEGKWRPIADDPTDGADTTAWIIKQPWSDGGVGTVGTSYAGATQHALAIANAPGLKTMIPVDAMSNTGRYGVRHNGAFELRFLNWVYTLGNAAMTPNETAAARRAAVPPEAAPALADFGNRVREYIFSLPLRPGTTPLKFAPGRVQRWLSWGLAAAVATYRQFGVPAYLDDELFLHGRDIAQSRASVDTTRSNATGTCASGASG